MLCFTSPRTWKELVLLSDEKVSFLRRLLDTIKKLHGASKTTLKTTQYYGHFDVISK